MAILKKGCAKYGPFPNKCGKNPPGAASGGAPRARQRPGGAAGGGARGIFLKNCLKMDRIFKHLFENGSIFKHMFENEPYLAHPIFKMAIGLLKKQITI